MQDCAYMVELRASAQNSPGAFSVLLDSTDCKASATELQSIGAEMMLGMTSVSSAEVSQA